jgi:UDP-glucose 4-epimerase
MRKPAFIEMGKTPWMMRRGMDFLEMNFRLSKLPLLPKIHPWTNIDNTDMRWLPINEDIQRQEDAPMPVDLLYRFIEEASHRAVYDVCACRRGQKCHDYPVDIGCLLMGDSALEGPPGYFHEASVEEARELTDRAVQAGLVPIVGKARIDNLIFGIKERHKLLTVCFCCECCCLTRFTRHSPLKYIDPTFPRLEGITVEVTEDCVGCGTCVDHCYIKAIEVVGGRAVMSGYCRTCGRCAAVCPNDAIRVSMDDPAYLDKTYERIRSYVKFD